MADIHNALRRGRLSKALSQVVGDTRSDGGLERYGETLQGIIDLWGEPEWAFSRQEKLWTFHLSAIAVVAEGSIVALTNPVGSGLLVVVEKITACNGTAAGQVIIGMADRAALAATLTASTQTFTRDQRAPVQTPPEAWSGSDPTVPFGGITYDMVISAAANQREPFISPPYIIVPGRGLLVQGNGLNQGIITTWVGRTRIAERGELV